MKRTSYYLAGLLLMVFTLMFAGCGDSENSTPTTATSTGSITADAAGTVAAGTQVSPPSGVKSMTFNAASILTDSSTPPVPVTGKITTTVTQTTNAGNLPAIAPAGTSLAVLLNITMSSVTAPVKTVKNFSTPLTAVVAVPAGVTSVDVYSYNGASWVLEQPGVAVSGGFATISITHLSYWGCFSLKPLTITTASPLPAGTVGTAYSQTLAASGGRSPYTWAGTPPAGLSLSPAGVISGTPTAAVTSSTFTVTVTDSATPPNTATKQFTLTVAAAGSPLTITTASPLPAGTVGTAYTALTFAATGGTGSHTWSGTPPAGLSLSSAGVLSGTPTASGTSTFTVTVTDSATPANTVSKDFSITINAATLAAPTNVAATGGTNSESITWTAVTGATSYNIYWSATTGVTTTNGTKITGVTSPYLHSRLTATPTWLAANTPYFYIVTAVSGAVESVASSPQATATTSAIDGVALYGTNCQGCHNALASSTKHDRTATQIQNAINTVGTMSSLSTLTPTQVQAIANVLPTGF